MYSATRMYNSAKLLQLDLRRMQINFPNCIGTVDGKLVRLVKLVVLNT